MSDVKDLPFQFFFLTEVYTSLWEPFYFKLAQTALENTPRIIEHTRVRRLYL